MLCVANLKRYSFEARDYRASRESMHTNANAKEASPAKPRDQQMRIVLRDSMENVQASSGYRVHDTIPSSSLQTTMAEVTDTL